jgi:hypothetical protein
MNVIEWIGITKFGSNPIGAVGFIGDNIVTIIAFYDDDDGNKDGKVSAGERIAGWLMPTKGLAVVEVAMQARVDPDIMLRDGSIQRIAMNLYLSFARGLIADGIYKAYFAPGIQMVGAQVAGLITSSMVKQFVIRKGFEAAVKEIVMAGLR